jgi:hypothetical protein
MKYLRTMVAVAAVTLAMTLPRVAAAQYHESRLDNFLDGHPQIKADLSSNPDLIYDKHYRRSHPELQKFMQDHPNIYAKLRKHGEGPQDLSPEAAQGKPLEAEQGERRQSEKRERKEAEKTENREAEKTANQQAEKTEKQEAKQHEHEQTVATTEHKQGHHGHGKGKSKTQ